MVFLCEHPYLGEVMKPMFKIKSRAVFALCLLPALCLGGCQKKEAEAKNPDPSKLASQLLEGVTFQDKLEETDKDAALTVLGLESYESKVNDCAIYLGTGATAEEVVVLQTGDEKGAQEIRTVLKENHLNRLKEDFQNYVPTEVPKIEDAALYAKGQTVALCVSSDSGKALEIMEEAMG